MSNYKPPWWVYKEQRTNARHVDARSLALAGMRPKPTTSPKWAFVAKARAPIVRDARMRGNRLPGYRVARTRRPAPLMVTKQAPEYMRPSESAYLNGSVLPEYAALNTNMLKLRQQNLPFGMKPRTIDAPDHY